MTEQLVTKSTLKSERGWTDSLITRFAGEPDQRKENPHYKKSAPMLLYRLDRIMEIEESEEFQTQLARSSKRKISSAQAVETKISQVIAMIEAFRPPDLPNFTPEELQRRAIEGYNAHKMKMYPSHIYDAGFLTRATPNSNRGFLDRITVSYVRHFLTEYGRELKKLSNRVGRRQGYVLIRNKILDAIIEAYPWLADEAESQRV